MRPEHFSAAGGSDLALQFILGKFHVITANSERDCFSAASSPLRTGIYCGGSARTWRALKPRGHSNTSAIGMEAAAKFPRG